MYDFKLSILGVVNLFVTLTADVALYFAGQKELVPNFTSNINRI